MADKTTVDTQPVTVLKYREDDLASIVLTWFVQVTALAAAITFGIFSVLSWTAAENAKEQANTANLLALAALCGNVVDQSSAYGSEVQDFCSQLFPVAWTPLAGAVAKTFPDLGSISPPKVPSGTTSAIFSSSSSVHTRPSSSAIPVTPSSGVSTSSTSSHPTATASPGSAAGAGTAGLGTGAKIGLGVGFAIGIPIVFVTALTYIRYRKLRREKVN